MEKELMQEGKYNKKGKLEKVIKQVNKRQVKDGNIERGDCKNISVLESMGMRC